ADRPAAGPIGTAPARAVAVTITDQGFVPATVQVPAGSRVTWTNSDAAAHQVAADPHPTHDSLPGLQSIALGKGGSFSHTFDAPGTYTYHDHQNPLKFRGTVVVE
ncbi:cupredoxin domain-containing protein, partial [Candidatus Parcubacteria bacterium]|nr:cupredoxin domain-containing protein [Candidatus Parcubacteria bacterium]